MTYLDITVAVSDRATATRLAEELLDPLAVDILPRAVEVHVRARGSVPEGFEIQPVLDRYAARTLASQEIAE